ncbi:MAG: glycoside hydrolase family 71/99-like protein [Verrucomicrobiota bacterium]
MTFRTHRLILTAGLLVCAATCAEAQLTTTVWNPAANPSGNGLWTESANWTGGVVPNSTNKVVLNISGARACVVASPVTVGQMVAGDGGPGSTIIITNGGSLSASAVNWSAIGYNNTNQTIVESGGAASFGNHLWVGYSPGSDGTLTMNGGAVSVDGMFGLGWGGGKGTVHVNGGVLNLAQWNSTLSIQGASVLDIGAGTVVITGNQVSSVSNFISTGKIIGYGGTGTVYSTFDGGANTTTLTANPGGGSYVTNLLSIKLASPNLVLFWPSSAGYYALQSTTNLAPPVVWKKVTNSVTTSNGTNQVIVSMINQMSFFRLASEVDPSTMNHKLLMGYQGWFSAPGDGSAQNSWVHWFGNNTPDAANAHIDLWPDTSELDADELFSTSMTYSNGQPAKLYSAYKQKTVVRHFKWMRENHLDGVFFQRFLSDLTGTTISALRNQVAVNVRVGAETYGRVFAIMYDISGYATNTLVSKLTNDWLYLVNTQQVTNSPAYLHHNGKPVVAIWGFGFSGRSDTPQQAQQVIDWFKAAGCTVMGGLPTNWRTLTGDAQTDPAWANVFRSFDVISPWSVGRYSNNSGADTFRNNYIVPDLADCTSHGIDYLPVIFPGFSWANLKDNGLYNQIPRNGGDFYWRQAYNAVRSGCTMVYGAMFDEVDEGTAMYKMAPTAAELPAQGIFVPLNIDGENLGSDWYLRLADQAGKMLRGEIPVTSAIPITPP